MITYLGAFSVGGLMPQMLSLVLGVIPRIRGQLMGALRVSGKVAVKFPTLSARIAMINRLAASIALQKPTVKVNVAANANLVASLQAQLAIYDSLKLALGEAGVEAFLLDGTAENAGAEFNGAIGAGLPGGRGSDHIYALVFATRFPATFTAMTKVFVKL